RRAIRSQAGWFGRATSPVPARPRAGGRCAVTVLPPVLTAPSFAESTALPGLARSIDLLPQGEGLRTASALSGASSARGRAIWLAARRADGSAPPAAPPLTRASASGAARSAG